MKKDGSSTRDKILAAAHDLFNQYGAHRVSPDKIIEEAGVAKMTFFRYFKTKNALIAENLRVCDEEWFGRFEGTKDIASLFDRLKVWFEEPNFKGSPFIKGLSEFRQDKDGEEILQVIDTHFTRLQKMVEEKVKAIQPKKYKTLTPQIISLMAGAIIIAQASGASEIAMINKEAAKRLLAES